MQMQLPGKRVSPETKMQEEERVFQGGVLEVRGRLRKEITLLKRQKRGVSLVVQGLRICLPTQGMQFQSLV